MIRERRICPLCERAVDGTFCGEHGVPPIDPARLNEIAGPGTRLGGRFLIEAPLSEGGMGLTFYARDANSPRRCVIKLAKGDGATVPMERVRRMFQEARALAMLDHPRIAAMLAFGVDETTGLPFLALELIEGEPLDQLASRTGPLKERRAAPLLRDVALALAHAHERGVLHRDLKPGNVMIERDEGGVDRARVLDFGLARLAKDKEDLRLTAPGTAVGTPWYMSPEQILGGALDGRSDLYALGCLVHAMLTGHPPVQSSNLLEAMKQQLRDPIPELPNASTKMRALHRKLLEKSRFDRPASAAEVAKMLQAIIESPERPVLSDRSTPAKKKLSIPAAPTVPKQDPLEHLETVIAPQPMDSKEIESGSEPAFLLPALAAAPSAAPPRITASRAPLYAASLGIAGAALIGAFLLRAPPEKNIEAKAPVPPAIVVREASPVIVVPAKIEPVRTASVAPKAKTKPKTKVEARPETRLPVEEKAPPKKDVEMPLW